MNFGATTIVLALVCHTAWAGRFPKPTELRLERNSTTCRIRALTLP
jgi:hypothetical protein